MSIIDNLRFKTKDFIKHQSGISMVEFGLLLPIFVLLLFGIIDISRYYHMHQKMDNAVSTMSHMINKNMRLSNTELRTYYRLLPTLLEPYDSNNLTFIVTSFERFDIDDPPTATWQVRQGSTMNISRIAATGRGSVANLPVTLEVGDQATYIEIYASYELILNSESFKEMLNLDAENIMYKKFISRPRYGAFTEIPS